MFRKLVLVSLCIALCSEAIAQVSNGRYAIISRHSGLGLDVVAGDTADGANVHQWEYWGGTMQQWDVASLGGGLFSIRAVHSGKSLDVFNWSMDPGGEIRQWAYWGGATQQWRIISAGSGYYTIQSALNGLNLDVWEWSTANGGDIRQWTPVSGAYNQQFSFVAVSSSGGGGGSTGGITGSSCGGGSTTTVTATIRVETGGTFDGGCRTYNAGSALGDGSQSESQDPIFRVGPGLIRNVYIGSNGADGIHTRNGGDVDNIHWSNVGEDAMTIKDPTEGATVTTNNVEGYDSADKFLQANDDGTWLINNCIVHDAGKFLRQNGGSTFPLHVQASNCEIVNMGEGVFRSDSPNSTARLTNSRLRNAGSICIGSWSSCTSSGITNF